MLELHWLKVEYRILCKTLITVHNCLSGKALDYLKKKFNFTQSSERYGLRSTKELNMLEAPKTKCITYGDRAFSAYGAHQEGIFYQVNSDVKKIVQLLRKVLKPCYLNDATIYEMI